MRIWVLIEYHVAADDLFGPTTVERKQSSATSPKLNSQLPKLLILEKIYDSAFWFHILGFVVVNVWRPGSVLGIRPFLSLVFMEEPAFVQ